MKLLDTYRTFHLDDILVFFPLRFSYLLISNPFNFISLVGLVFNLEEILFPPSLCELTLPFFPTCPDFSHALLMPCIFHISRILLLIGIMANSFITLFEHF